MCTSLGYKDAAGNAYFGRTLELTMDLPYQVVHFPAGFETTSEVPDHPALKLTARHAILAVTMPYRVPTATAPMTIADLKILEGLNDQGLTFSLLSYPAAGGTQKSVDATQAVLSASDLGAWALGQFASVAEVKAAIAEQPVMLQPLGLLKGVESPFHYVVHDATGAALVIEFDHGAMKLYDNPVGVMTNGPKFDWHLTNLDNYSFLSNVDQSSATFGSYKAVQPDSGIATAGLPSSNTSVGRFVRAVYYAQFTEKAASPDLAVQTVAHILNNFDRPRGVSIDYPSQGGGHMEVEGLAQSDSEAYATEFTCWTSLSDLARKLFFVRDYRSLNYTCFDLNALSGSTLPSILPLQKLPGGAIDATSALMGKGR
ncbi:linear amide C-N hydrolase [Kaistia dalseonensis]|uniref:Penicillin V acylase-like amidase (Ntn superfamily) n=1 Tax=Kaistia dalseonensis TaxID=410840 RepID=A0ABU0H7N8_9HYPH|nr:linear amide C-N hydrolase [Kaistia dalseonensis]MCX5495724.1 linear amide C-N hydrolase [Kaistia dalseonensis]MDQ0438321.1 penicillin V acylase-like amidase (Ntn superfamily) [Kaistia dalseonensis]